MVTANEHDAVRCSESVAVHETVVEPSGNVDPDAEEQLTVTGAWPPAGVGGAYVAGIPTLSGDSIVIDAGQLTVGAAGGGGGVVGDPPHPAEIRNPRNAATALERLTG
ncbi:MAG: hypothetical protein AMXMBFR57_00660 [Acidimicrobiia bacterium]|jgi:hypothetical protein